MQDEMDAARIVRASLAAYPARDRAAIEAVLAEDFHFSSPLDNRIDRQTYFARCWPNGEAMERIDLRHVAASGDKVFAAYEVRMKDGRRFKNAELFTVRGGKITDVEVYFGWSIPHEAPEGGFVPEKPGAE